MLNIGVIGSGRWATFLAWYANLIGHKVTLCGRSASSRFKELVQTRKNATVTLDDKINFTTEITDLNNSDYILVAVAAQSLREVLGELKAACPIILCMKGLESSSGKRLSQVAKERVTNPVAVWLGPGHPQDFIAKIPNCMVIDSEDKKLKKSVADAFTSPLIRIYYGSDLIGNEIGAAAKNVVGIAAGVLDGSGKSSLKGALMARGAYEISVLTEKLGGDPRSAYGLCHLGDYEATLFSPHSHNRLYGERFVQGLKSEVLAEGYYSVPAFIELAKRNDVELPICQAVYDLLYNKEDAETVLERLFARAVKSEF